MTPRRDAPNDVLQMSRKLSIDDFSVRTEDEIMRLYRDFLSALRAQGQNPVIDFHVVAQKSQEQRSSVRQTYGVQALEMLVAFEDGRTCIRIHPA